MSDFKKFEKNLVVKNTTERYSSTPMQMYLSNLDQDVKIKRSMSTIAI